MFAETKAENTFFNLVTAMSWTSWLSSGDSSSARARNLTGAHIRWAAVTKYEFSASSSQHRRCLNLNQCGVQSPTDCTLLQCSLSQGTLSSPLPALSIKTSNKRKAMVEGEAKGIALPRYFLPRANHHSWCPFPLPPAVCAAVRACGRRLHAAQIALPQSGHTHTRTHWWWHALAYASPCR